MKIDKTYIITYDENIPKIWRVVDELMKIWLYNIEIINWVNAKTIRFHQSNDPDLSIINYTKGNWEWASLELPYWSINSFVPSNCACMLSHKIAFEKAKEEWYETVLMVEDDLLFSYKANRYLQKILDSAPEDRDMLRLEWNDAMWMWKKDLISERWFRVDLVWSTACILFSKNAINHICNVMDNRPAASFDYLTNNQCDELNSYTSLWNMWIQYPL